PFTAISMSIALAVAIMACTAPGGDRRDRVSAPSASSAPSAAPKTLTIGLDEDLRSLWNVATEGGGGSEAQHLMHAIHQPLAANPSDGSASARVLRELPSVDRGTWKLLADGSMETTLLLRDTVRWHDGTPLTAADVTLGYEVFRDPDIPNSNQEVVKRI